MSIAAINASNDPASYVGQVVFIPPQRVKRLPNQPRTHFSAKALEALRESIREIGQQQPATVIPWEDRTFRLRDGERRWRCCTELKRPLLALVVDAKSEEEEFELSTAANMNRESHSPLEKALAMKRLRDGPLQRTPDEIALTFGVTRTTVDSHLLIVDELAAEIVALMDPNEQQGGRLRTLQISAAVRLTALKKFPREQLTIARRIVRDNLSIGEAGRLIDQFADAKNIREGRGRQRSPADHLDLLRTALRNVEQKIGYFARLDQQQINEFFAFIPARRYQEVFEQISEGVNALMALAKKIDAVEGIGKRRKAS